MELYKFSYWLIPSVSLLLRSFESFRSDFIIQLEVQYPHIPKSESMGRGVSSGGGQSSLGYLFGSGESPQPVTPCPQPPPSEGQSTNNGSTPKSGTPPPIDVAKQIPAGIHSTSTNNYLRADGQNAGNFITDRPSTKVHAAPGGGSSLGYLFGDGTRGPAN